MYHSQTLPNPDEHMLSNHNERAKRARGNVGALSQARSDVLEQLFANCNSMFMNFITLAAMCVCITKLEQWNGCVENQKNHHMGFLIPSAVIKEQFLKRLSDERIRILEFVVGCEDPEVLDGMKQLYESGRKMLKIISTRTPRPSAGGGPPPFCEGNCREIELMLVSVWVTVDNFRSLCEN